MLLSSSPSSHLSEATDRKPQENPHLAIARSSQSVWPGAKGYLCGGLERSRRLICRWAPTRHWSVVLRLCFGQEHRASDMQLTGSTGRAAHDPVFIGRIRRARNLFEQITDSDASALDRCSGLVLNLQVSNRLSAIDR